MPIKEFAQKSFIVTACISFLLYMFYPRYEFTDIKTRFDKVSGRSSVYSDNPYNGGWGSR